VEPTSSAKTNKQQKHYFHGKMSKSTYRPASKSNLNKIKTILCTNERIIVLPKRQETIFTHLQSSKMAQFEHKLNKKQVEERT